MINVFTLRFFAGAAPVFALTLNVIVTLDDPFLFMSDVAIATDVTASDAGTGGSYLSVIIPKCTWKTVTFDVDFDGKVVNSSIKWSTHSCTFCAKYCDAQAIGVCTKDELCPVDDPDPAN